MKVWRPPAYPSAPHASGQARITDRAGRSIYLGRFGSPESREEYRRVVAELVRHDGEIPARAGLTVAQLVRCYLKHAAGYYVKRGRRTTCYDMAERVLTALARSHGGAAADAFRPADLKALRAGWEAKLAVVTCNSYAATVVRCWRWAADEELVRPEAALAMRAVTPLRAGRSPARVHPPVRPARPEDVDAVLADLDRRNPTVAAMVRVQRLCAMRPIEVCYVRPMDLHDRDRLVWKYVVPAEANKKAHEARERLVPIGPRTRAIIAPFLAGVGPQGAIFRPPSHAWRKSATWPGYGPGGYAQILRAACRRAGVHFSPNQLRHLGATEVRRAAGTIEAARQALGHSDAATTSIYAKADYESIVELFGRIG